MRVIIPPTSQQKTPTQQLKTPGARAAQRADAEKFMAMRKAQREADKRAKGAATSRHMTEVGRVVVWLCGCVGVLGGWFGVIGHELAYDRDGLGWFLLCWVWVWTVCVFIWRTGCDNQSVTPTPQTNKQLIHTRTHSSQLASSFSSEWLGSSAASAPRSRHALIRSFVRSVNM